MNVNTVHDLNRAALGGGLIGLAAGLLMLSNGRAAGISGLFAGLLGRWPASWKEDVLFLAGLPLGGLAFRFMAGEVPVTLAASPLLLLAGGLLVGVGTQLGSGCTSGHAVCGLARFSLRSFVATVLFMAAAMAAVAVRKFL
jgi:hypothetical protein